MDAADDLLIADRCTLAVAGPRGPLVAPMGCWFDGEALWMTTALDSAKIRAIRRDAQVAVAVPAADGHLVTATGTARVYGTDHPRSLLLHSPGITGAMTAMVLRNPRVIAGYVRDAAQVPKRFAPAHRAVMRVTVSATSRQRLIAPRGGVAPPLPTVIPPEVRRRLSGRRQVLVAMAAPHLELVPASWDGDLQLEPPLGRSWPEGGSVAVLVDADPRTSPVEVAGAVIHGSLHAGQLTPERATWWRGFDLETADVPSRPAGGVLIPD